MWRSVHGVDRGSIRLVGGPIDVIGLYQHTWNTSTVQKLRRKQIWTSLQKLLKEIPNRHPVCLLGDFNCSLPSILRLVGQAHFSTPGGKRLGPQHGDMSILAHTLTDFQLVALNTWTPHLGAWRSSRIDCVMARHVRL